MLNTFAPGDALDVFSGSSISASCVPKSPPSTRRPMRAGCLANSANWRISISLMVMLRSRPHFCATCVRRMAGRTPSWVWQAAEKVSRASILPRRPSSTCAYTTAFGATGSRHISPLSASGSLRTFMCGKARLTWASVCPSFTPPMPSGVIMQAALAV